MTWPWQPSRHRVHEKVDHGLALVNTSEFAGKLVLLQRLQTLYDQLQANCLAAAGGYDGHRLGSRMLAIFKTPAAAGIKQRRGLP